MIMSQEFSISLNYFHGMISKRNGKAKPNFLHRSEVNANSTGSFDRGEPSEAQIWFINNYK